MCRCWRPVVGNLANNLGPIRWTCGRLDCVCWQSSSSTSVGMGQGRFGGGLSSHWCMAISRPWPKARFGRGRGVVVVGSVARSVACKAWMALSRAGSSLWSGQVCHGSPHLHSHCLTNNDLRHKLHHTLVSRLWVWNAGLVPGSWCVHRGHLK